MGFEEKPNGYGGTWILVKIEGLVGMWSRADDEVWSLVLLEK